MHKLTRSGGNIDPDLSKCRTSSIGAVIPGTKHEMYYCRIDHADCRYAMSLGFDYLCKHPGNFVFRIPNDADPESSPVSFPSDSSG